MAESDNTTSPTAPPSVGRRRHIPLVLLTLVLVAAAALAFGWPTRSGDFLSGDDQRFVVNHFFVNHPSLRHAGRLLTMVHEDLYQPVPMLSFQANYAMAGADPATRFGANSYAFHITNIVLHALNAVLASLVMLLLARRHGGTTTVWACALIAGLMFACHPLAVEPVAWISGRMILLATTFSLLLILACLSRRDDGRGAWAWLGGVAWVLALLSKVLPGVPVAAAWCDHQVRRHLPRRCWIVYAMLLAATCAAVWLGVQTSSRFGMIEGTEAEATTSAPVRILLAGRTYLENYVWPTRMAAWSPPPDNVAMISTQTGIALLEWVLFGGLVWLARRHNRMAYIGLVLFVILIAPFLGATLARRIHTADRYMYLPMLGLHIAVAALLLQARHRIRQRMPAAVATGLVTVPFVAVLVAWMSVAWSYADCWTDTVARDRRVAAVHSNRVEAHTELARAYIFDKQPDAALRTIAQACQQNPDWTDNPRLASEAGEAYWQQENWSKAAEKLAFATRHMPDRARTRYYYGLSLEQLGRIDEARACYREIRERDDGFLPAITALARSLRTTGEIESAAALFERAIEINPFHRDCLFELALIHLRAQDWRRAEDLLRRILELDPTDAPALLNLGVTLSATGRTQQAIDIYDKLITMEPKAATPRLNRAGLLAANGRPAEAEQDYRILLAANPGHRAAAVGLHELLQSQQRFDELVKLWGSLIATDGHPDDAPAWLAWAHVLAGHGETARQVIAQIPNDAQHRTFADWALAFDALRSGDHATFRHNLGPAIPMTDIPAVQRDQAGAVMTALHSLPRHIRESPAGLYALARAVLFSGDGTMARTIASQIAEIPNAGQWADAARQIIEIVNTDIEPTSAGENKNG